MRKFIAVVVPSEAKAAESLRALRELHATGTISIYETVVIERELGGRIATKDRSTHLMRRTGIGTLLGALAGVFGGPAGVIIGARDDQMIVTEGDLPGPRDAFGADGHGIDRRVLPRPFAAEIDFKLEGHKGAAQS